MIQIGLTQLIFDIMLDSKRLQNPLQSRMSGAKTAIEERKNCEDAGENSKNTRGSRKRNEKRLHIRSKS